MGVIKDGSISGILPSKKVFAVNYPGYPSSTERALMTLGGPEGIAKARQSPTNNLELHFRPEDPYSHPAFGERSNCNQFLLKISKLNNTNVDHDQTQTSEGSEVEICADIVSHVSEAYNFKGMVDYQHVLAVHADVARKKKRNWADVEPHFEKRGLIDADQEDLMILLPPLFSIKNIPENVVLKPSMYISLKKKQEGIVKNHWEKDIEPSLAIDFNTKDNVPKKVDWEKYIQIGTDEWKCQMAVYEMFDERPVWIKESLSEHLSDKGLKLVDNYIRRLLFRVAYYFSNGPFQRFWIKKGYDPRKDPESRIYQRIDFRVPESLRSYCLSGIASGLKNNWKDLCAFKVFPYKCQVSLQLFELDDDYIQQEIKKPSTQMTCTLATGWFPPHIYDIFLLCVAVRFLSVYPNSDAESLLKSKTSRLEKSKRTRTVFKEQTVNEDKRQQSNKVEGHIEEKEMSNDEDDDGVDDDDVEEEEEEEEEEEDDDDDMEDENLGNDFDASEGFDMTGDGTDLLPEPSSINEENNISKNYLQDLFGSFPYGGGSQDDENSDGEYQIYDQYSDGNESDDDY
ncbi:uncharacterized protein [Rutidosis leptorrhynchoides]|uniref:uncharacterized protein n=1 Tax=Rutidosis leptorrhynchoides TaxID=125765 RepID=UPI003A98FB7B